MDIQEVRKDGLKHELRVVVPAEEVNERTEDRLAELAKTIQLPGFRKGKVPVSHLKRLYGRQVRAEALEEALKESMDRALREKGLRSAYEPEVEIEGGEEATKKAIEEGADLAYVMKFETLPEFEVPEDFSDLELVRYRVKVPDSDIDEALENLAKQFRDFEDKPEGAAAEKGDRVVISFVGRINGEEFEGGSAEDVPLELGSGQFIPGFEDQLIGAKAGEERTIEVTFPKEYGVEKLAGKKAEFTVRVKSVEAPLEQKIDDAFAQKLGFDDLAALREKVREQLAAELEQEAFAQLKQDVLDALDERFDFPVPERMVEQEFAHVWQTVTSQMQQQNRTFEDEGTTEEEARKEYRDIAERRVRLGLAIGRIGEKAGIEVTSQELRDALIAKARQYPGQERQVIEFYEKTPEALIELRGPIFEAKVLDHIIAQAKVEEKEVTPEELRALLEEEEEAKAAEEAVSGHDSENEKKTPAERKSAATSAGGADEGQESGN